jgi:hypothetical protein
VATLSVSPAAPPAEELDAPLRTVAEPPNISASGKPIRKSEQVAQTLVLAILFAGPALMCVHAASVSDPDVWWHLRTGEWMLQHHAVPRVDPFSGVLAGKPWQAYSWLFELIVVKLFQRFGLVGIVGYSVGMVLAITVAMRHLVKRLQSDFSIIILLTFAACFSLGPMFTPRPWMFTILFFVLELDILMQARRTGRLRELVWLPLIFALWANVHIEFVDGLLVMGLAFAESVVARWWTAAETRVRPTWMGAALLASVLATLANPYGWRIYGVVYDYTFRLATHGSVLNQVSELQAIPFRNIADFLILVFAMGSAAALAWHRRLPLFESALLIFAAVLSFRSQRDIWVMATVSAAILASRIVIDRPAIRSPKLATTLALIAAAIAVPVGFRMLRVNNARLETKLAESLPVHAVEAVRAMGYAGPLYDDYNWGGYLIWALRMPVSMDGRASFYGDRKIARSVMTWNAEPDWASDPALASAGLVIGPAKAALTQLLRKDPRFQLVYEDKLAAVFIVRK